jgi:uncharacterized membrane protein YebE (DUF533 family)
MTDLVPPPSLEGAAPTLIMETVVLRFLARVIHADGVVDPREVKLLLDVAAGLEMGEEEARRILEDELNRVSDASALARQIPDPDERLTVYSLGCAMAYAEGHLGDEEKAILSAFARGAGIDAIAASEILADAAREAAHA